MYSPRALIGAFLLAAGCARPQPAPLPRSPAPAPLPELGAGIPEPAPVPRAPRPPTDPLASTPPGNPITLSARNVDVRVLLLAIAEEAGVSLVIDPTIEGRTTVNLANVPAREALRAVLAGAGLRIAPGPLAPLFGPVVFYAIPVDIDEASAELIQARFRVEPELARWIVESRSIQFP